MLEESIELTARDRGRLWACDVFSAYTNAGAALPLRFPRKQADAMPILRELGLADDPIMFKRLVQSAFSAAREQWRQLVEAERRSGVMRCAQPARIAEEFSSEHETVPRRRVIG